MKLFLIPYAGSSASIYSDWGNYLNSNIEIVPLELNGRGKLCDLEHYATIEDAVNDLYNRIKDKIEEDDYAIFGHSMGSLIAYELYYRIKEANAPLPKHMIFSGCRGPECETELDKYIQLDEDEFKKKLIEIGGISDALIKNRALFHIYSKIIRKDFEMVSTYQYKQQEELVSCCVTLFSGKDDFVEEKDIMKWRKYCKRGVTLYSFEGNHFFLNDAVNKSKMAEIINNQLIGGACEDESDLIKAIEENKKNRKKALELQKPMIFAVPTYACLFSMISFEKNRTMQLWTYNSLINMKYVVDWSSVAYDQHEFILEHAPVVKSMILTRNFVRENFGSVINFIKQSVDNGYYLFAFVDRYYLPQYVAYQNEHMCHEITISGYDLEKGTVIISDNWDNGKYAIGECTIQEMEDAYFKLNLIAEDWQNIRLMKPCSNEKYKFNIEQVINELKNYYYSRASLRIGQMEEAVYGFDVYKVLLKEIDEAVEYKIFIDVKFIHFIYEHKSIMEKRILFMQENGYIDSENSFAKQAAKLTEEYKKVRDRCVKYDILLLQYKECREDILTSMKELIIKNIEKEKKFIKELIEYLEQKNFHSDLS